MMNASDYLIIPGRNILQKAASTQEDKHEQRLVLCGRPLTLKGKGECNVQFKRIRE